MLYFILTIDGDWRGYFDIKLSEEERLPKSEVLEAVIQKEIDIVKKNLDGKCIHFIHTSFRARDFFLQENFLGLWKKIVKNGGDVGLHCHEDDPYKNYYYNNSERMKKVITERVRTFRSRGLDIKSYRSGFLGFSTSLVKILEDNGILYDFSCAPERFSRHENTVICDWREAPLYHHRMNYNDHCKEGDAQIREIPLGASRGKYLYFETVSLKELEEIAIDLERKTKEEKRDYIVSVLSHTSEYAQAEVIKKIEQGLLILKKYGKFINIGELNGKLAENSFRKHR